MESTIDRELVPADYITNFEDQTDKEVIESMLYTSCNMFGEIQFDAEQELKRRYPPPAWCYDANGKRKG